jgi:hypothetical protein
MPLEERRRWSFALCAVGLLAGDGLPDGIEVGMLVGFEVGALVGLEVGALEG